MQINQMVFDSENKEYVSISNGIPIVEGKPEITPTEAIALRVVGLQDGKPLIAWTYRRVNADKLHQCASDNAVQWFKEIFTSSFRV